MTRQPIATAGALALALGLATTAPATAQEFKNREEVNNYYSEKFTELEKQHIAALGEVAAKEQGEAAEATYRLLFNLAIARNLYPAAEPAAEAVIDKGGVGADLNALAHFINAVAEADRGKYDESLSHLKSFVGSVKPEDIPSRRLDPQTVLTIGEAYFQRLVQADQYEVAKDFCEFAVEKTASPAVRAHFAERLERVNMLGAEAPAISAKDVDGNEVKLADYKGKVVLVEFWATWCPPCGPQLLRVNAVQEKYKDQGFQALGVNVDALREGAGADVTPAVRRFLIDHGVAWPNLLNGTGAQDYTEAYGVGEIPANFLIGKDGKIIGFELGEGNMDAAIAKALGVKKAE